MKVLLLILRPSNQSSDKVCSSRATSDKFRDNFDRIFHPTQDDKEDKAPQSSYNVN